MHFFIQNEDQHSQRSICYTPDSMILSSVEVTEDYHEDSKKQKL